MTIEEKIGQMTLIENNSLQPGDVGEMMLGGVLSGGDGAPDPNTPEAWADMIDSFQREALSTRLAIPLLYGVDAVHGHALLQGATVFPHNIGLGATGNAELVEQIGRATAIEAAATGVNWNYGPVLAVVDDIRWGRTYEAYGADPTLVAELGAAFVAGLQHDDLGQPGSVLATPKHWIGDGSVEWDTSTTGDYSIDQGVTPASPELLEALAAPYEAAFDAGARSVMASFSSWGSEKVHGSEELLTGALRGDYGFDGFVVSDWAGVDQVAPFYVDAVIASVNAGVDMNMVPSDGQRFAEAVMAGVTGGQIDPERIDEAVRRILTVKFELGLFEDPFATRSLADQIASSEHRDLARQAVQESAVLLRNDGALPLARAEDAGPIFVGGLASDDVGRQAGGWTLSWQGSSGDDVEGGSLTEALIAEFGEENIVQNARGRFDTLTDAAPSACVVAIGESPYSEGVGDSATLDYQGRQIASDMAEICPSLIVVIISGRPVIITDEIDGWDAVVAAWLPGSEAGGVVDVLTGAAPFTGTLPVAWPASVEDLPLAPGSENALFDYGYGLSLDSGEASR